MIPLGKIVKVGRWAMGKSGWLQTAKSGKSNAGVGVVAGVLVQLGIEMELALLLAVGLVTAADAGWEVIRKYEVVNTGG